MRLQHHAPRQAVPVRRADHGPALRGRREAAARVPQAAGRRALAAGHRAQPRRHPRRRLDHRPGPGGRRARRRDRLRRHAGAGARDAALLHRPGAGRLRRRHSAAAAAPPSRRSPSPPLRLRRRAHGRGHATPIVIHNAREHNLKNIDVEIPRDRFTVITGVSGSGKSTLAFDILFNEGQRRYLESLNAYARQFVQPAARPDVDAIFGIPPTVAIEQRTSRGGRKSTVATLTEIYHFLRLLYVKLGTQYCPDCDVADRAAEPRLDRRAPAARLQAASASRCSRRWWSRARATTPTSPSGPRRRASRRLRVDGAHAADRALAAPVALQGAHHRAAGGRARRRARRPRRRCARRSRARSTSARAWCTCSAPQARRASTVFSTKRACPSCGTQLRRARSAPVLLQLQARLVRELLRHRRRDARLRRGAERRGDLVERVVRARAAGRAAPAHGERLNPIALNVRFRERSIAALAAQPVAGSRRVLRASCSLEPREREIAPRPAGRDPRAPAVPRARGPGLSAARPLRADALRRRGAAHPPRRAARLEPAGRVLRARRAHHRPASARQRRSCSTRSPSWQASATPWSSSSTTRTPSAAPIT